MKKIISCIMGAVMSVCVLGSFFFSTVEANDSPSGGIITAGDVGVVKPIICAGEGECGIDEGIQALSGSLNDIESSRSISDFIQDIVVFVLSFVSVIAVVYIIYAGFMIMLGNGDEEKLKKSKQTIFYVIIGIVVMWLAYPITRFVIGALS